MKCCLNANQPLEYRKKADEIKLLYKDRLNILEYTEQLPQTTIILDLKNCLDNDIDWEEIKRYNIMIQNKLIVALSTLSKANFCKINNIKFYLNYPITTFYDLQALYNLGAEYALIDSPLVQNIKKASEIGIKLRVVPNVAYYAIIPRENGVCGSWIRPEDLYLYEDYISAIEFEDCDIKKEQALYRIYFEQKSWPGDLKTIITNLNYPGVNRMIPNELAEKRMSCGQRCMFDSRCKLCFRYLDLANPELLNNRKKVILK